MNINERARTAIASYLQANGLAASDTITMRLRINRAGAYCDVVVTGGGLIRTANGHYNPDVRWNRWSLSDFIDKIDRYLQSFHNHRANTQQDMAVFRTLIEKLETKSGTPPDRSIALLSARRG